MSTVQGRRLKSFCWHFMTVLPDRSAVQCNICQTMLSRHSGTTHLNRHLLTLHKDEVERARQNGELVPVPILAKKGNIRKSTSTNVKTEPPYLTEESSPVPVQIVVKKPIPPQVEPPSETQSSKPKSNAKTVVHVAPEVQNKKARFDPYFRMLDQKVLDFIVMDNEPLSIVEQKGFQGLVSALEPTYKLVTQDKLANELLPARYQTEKEKLLEELKTVEHVSVSVDCWKSYAGKAYITLSAHYITTNWQLKTRCLATKSDGTSHTVETLASAMQDIFREFEIEEKVMTVVTDNVIDISDVVEAINAKYQVCFAHTLNQVIKETIEGVEPIKSLVKCVRDIVAHFNSSTMAANNLSEIHQRKGNPAKKLEEEMINGWNSTFDMLQSYICQHDEVTTVLSLSERHELCFQSPSDVQILRTAVSTLQPFYEATQELSREKFTTASKIIPMMKMLKKLAGRCNSALSKRLQENLDRRFGRLEEVPHLQVATLLDPRFKKTAFSSYEAAFKAVEQLMKDAKRDKVSCEWEPLVEVESETPQEENQSGVLWSDFDNEISTNTNSSENISAVEGEVMKYLEKQPLPRHKDPLQWWKDNGWSLPKLEAVARNVLAIPATAVPSDRLFSKEGQIVVFKRSKLSSDNIDKVLFLLKNLENS